MRMSRCHRPAVGRGLVSDGAGEKMGDGGLGSKQYFRKLYLGSPS